MGRLQGNVQRYPPHPHWFMCYITLITPLSRGWWKLDSILVPGCPTQAVSVFGLKSSGGGSQIGRSDDFHFHCTKSDCLTGA